MEFEDSFCSSPWIHMRVSNSGRYEYCRWADTLEKSQYSSLQKESPITFFQQGMADFRKQLLDGHTIKMCNECYLQEQHNKINGRRRQLLKVGVSTDFFEQSMLSSPWLDEFVYSNNNQGQTKQTPQDWQVDLGNYCNSGCIFCSPHSSSSLATEFKKIGLIKSMPAASWAEDPTQLQIFLDALKDCNKIAYIHFIGGETLITPAFKKILIKLIELDLHRTITIGFTTNLITWDQKIIDLLAQFHSVNLGVSIECDHPLNDYVRFPSQLTVVQENFKRWDNVAKEHNWIKVLRITPTVLSIYHLDTIYQLAWKYNWSVESCNFLNNPEFMRPSVLPENYRQLVIDKLQTWTKSVTNQKFDQVVNTRNPDVTKIQVVQDANSYINYLKDQPYEVYRLSDLIKFLKTIEQSRGNRILDYLPEYEELLKSAGY